jgi:hypothetical protein
MEENRKAGKLAKPTGGPRFKGHRVAKKPDAKTLADQGIDKNLADRTARRST